MFLLLACSQAPDTHANTDAYSDVSETYIEHELNVLQQPPHGFVPPGNDCNDAEYDLGLSLTTVPAGTDILVTAVDEFETVLYQETIRSNDCGVATPFTEVSSGDFGSSFNDWSFGVYANVVTDPSFYEYGGVLIEDGMSDIPVTTQWYYDVDRGGWYAIRHEELGIMIGNAMMP